MKNIMPLIAICLYTQMAFAQFPDGSATKLLTTDPLTCDPQLGKVKVDVDPYGAIGSSINGYSNDYHYDVVDDNPDQGFVRTIYEWMSFLCSTNEQGATAGLWLTNENLSQATVREENGQIFSEFSVNNRIRVNVRYQLNCSVVEYCYTFTNISDTNLPVVSITPYLDGDLYFGANPNLSNDYGATSIGRPKKLWEFDEGDNPSEPSTFVGIYGLGMSDNYLHSWEIGRFSNQRNRISDTSAGCYGLRNDLNNNESNADTNQDLITDSGFDVTLALRYDVGPLAPNQTSNELCYAIQWGKSLPCSDEDLDQICLPEDNCPATPNPDQTDTDRDGTGDACDPCPNLANEGPDADGDGTGNACDLCPTVFNIDQSDADADGIGDICDLCPQIPGNGGGDQDSDGIGNACDNCVDVANPDQRDLNNDGFGDACCTNGTETCDLSDNDCDGRVDEGLNDATTTCPTGRSGACSVGLMVCENGMMVCQPQVDATDEIKCNGIDENCNGLIDENLRNECGQCGALPSESCNGIDDDCNGTIDDGENLCPNGQACQLGTCVNYCDSGECASPFSCVDGVCLLPCQITPCEIGSTCDLTTGACVSSCSASCPSGEVCVNGSCFPDNCYTRPCADGLACVNGACVADPCANVMCGNDQFCRDGVCVGSCAFISCSYDQQCIDGNCVNATCGDILCADGQVCQNGQCVADPCIGVMCSGYETCVQGICQGNPCVNVDCPPGTVCDPSSGVIQCVLGGQDPNNAGNQAGTMGGTAGTMGGAGAMGGNAGTAGTMMGGTAGTAGQPTTGGGIFIGATPAGSNQGGNATGALTTTAKDSGCQSKAQSGGMLWVFVMLMGIFMRRFFGMKMV